MPRRSPERIVIAESVNSLCESKDKSLVTHQRSTLLIYTIRNGCQQQEFKKKVREGYRST
ncbi:MAG TPA: hypothetical protein DD670_18540 [Planctomycetaceae bacterium]|nr:hypothetical protein [Planctomycetaceae bacterium]